MGKPLQLSIIPVMYNSEEHVLGTISALEGAIRDLDAEIVVVDNASTDRTGELARKHLRTGRVVRLDRNVGYGGGANAGLRHARGRRSLIMNDDVTPEPGCIERLMEVLDSSPSIALVGPRMLQPDASAAPATRSYLPGWRDEFARLGDLLSGKESRTAYPEGSGPIDVGLLIAAFVMADTELLRSLGGFNPAFYMYGEDIDLCQRLQRRGYRCVTVPDAAAVHDQTVAMDRRYDGRDFVNRILRARDTYYRIWLSRPSRMLINFWRAMGYTDQPYRLRYHLSRAFYDGESLSGLRSPPPLELADGEGPVREPLPDRFVTRGNVREAY